MSVTWQVGDIENHMELWVDDPISGRKLDGVTNTLIMACLSIGVQQITERNWSEVLWRLKEHEKLYGALMGGPDGDWWFTEEHVRRRIGLKVNAVPFDNKKFDLDLKRRQKEHAEEQAAKSA